MDPAILSTASGLIGSLVGGVSTLVASWITHHKEVRVQTLLHEALKRETLYSEFITEASKRFADAWDHQAESPEVFAGLFAAVERMSLISSEAVVRAAENVVLNIVEAYAHPNRTFDEARGIIADRNSPLTEFTDACRQELKVSHGLPRA